MNNYLLIVGSIAKGSNFDNSMVQRQIPYWGLSKSGHIDTINAAIAKGEDVAIWLRGTKATCIQKYGNERLLGVFIVKSITKRQLGPRLLRWNPTIGNWDGPMANGSMLLNIPNITTSVYLTSAGRRRLDSKHTHVTRSPNPKIIFQKALSVLTSSFPSSHLSAVSKNSLKQKTKNKKTRRLVFY
jgi:hypothetical protein